MLQWTLGHMCLFELWFSQGICPVVGLINHMMVLFLVFKGISILFSTVVICIYIPTNYTRVFPFLTSSLVFIVCIFLDDGHSDWHEVRTTHYSFDLHFSNNEQHWTSFNKWGLSQGCKDSSIYANQSVWYTILTNWKIKAI